jgi:hypothetical protein
MSSESDRMSTVLAILRDKYIQELERALEEAQETQSEEQS